MVQVGLLGGSSALSSLLAASLAVFNCRLTVKTFTVLPVTGVTRANKDSGWM